MEWIKLHFTTVNITGMLIALLAMLGVCIWAQSFRRKTYNIIGKRNFFFVLSIILLLAGIWSLSTHGLNFGLDFTGGTIIEAGFYSKVTSDQIRETIAEVNPEYENATIQIEKKEDSAGYEGITKVLIRVKELKQADNLKQPRGTKEALPEGKKEEKSQLEIQAEKIKITKPKIVKEEKIQTVIPSSAESYNQKLGSENVNNLIKHLNNRLGKVEIYKIESIGPVIGDELKKKAIFALLIALGTQLIYITLRFGNQLRYGLAADIAMAHDIIIMVGIYSIFSIFNKQIQADSPFLAALLTVIGYSIMDSIIIFDRIRENIKIYQKENFEKIVNISVNQTMTRSINTLATCLLSLFAIYFFGGATLKNFAFALLIGLTSGGYSSIFIASPLLVMLDKFVKNREAKTQEARRRQLLTQAEAKRKEKEAEKLKKETEGRKFKNKPEKYIGDKK